MKLSNEQLTERIQSYQQEHKNTAEKIIKDNGSLMPPFLTLLVYSDTEETFKQIHVGIPEIFFTNATAKRLFINEFVPANLEAMLKQGMIPTALTISMEANMRMGEKGDNVDDIMNKKPMDILLHSFETLSESRMEMLQILKSDVQVVNEHGDVVDDITLEPLPVGDENNTPTIEGPFANILQRFQEF